MLIYSTSVSFYDSCIVTLTFIVLNDNKAFSFISNFWIQIFFFTVQEKGNHKINKLINFMYKQ